MIPKKANPLYIAEPAFINNDTIFATINKRIAKNKNIPKRNLSLTPNRMSDTPKMNINAKIDIVPMIAV